MRLMPDSPAPALIVPTVGGGTYDLSQVEAETLKLVTFYRGLHCPVCKGYLGGLNEMVDDFAAAGTSVVAVSMDTPEKAAAAKEEWGITKVEIGHSLSEADARNWGLWISEGINEVEAQIFCEPGTFLIRPDGRLYLISISNMPWGRMALAGLPDKIRNVVVGRSYPARGTK